MISSNSPFVLLFCSILLGNAAAFPKSHYHKYLGNNVTNRNNLSYRAERYLFPLALINFPPEPCTPTSSQFLDGSCLSKKKCKAAGGESVGACQQGIGTCCKIDRQCSANTRAVIVTESVEHLRNSNVTGSCEFVFPKQPGICQVRLDFGSLTLEVPQTIGPNAGNCKSESLTVVGAANLIGPLKVCGSLKGQHMILSYGKTSEKISVTMHSEKANQDYDIRATQIPCNSINKAPDDCLQYYTTTTAAIKSFGFPNQLNSQRYTICVHPNSGGSSLTWNICETDDADGALEKDRFNVSSEESKPNCDTDWIAFDWTKKHCGETFEKLTTKDTGSSARVRVNFDENETGDDVFFFNVSNVEEGKRKDVCMGVANSYTEPMSGGDPVATSKNLCYYIDSKICRCKFSNIPNGSGTPQWVHLTNMTSNNADELECPIIQGYSPTEIKHKEGNCQYYANIRIADTTNTGFCLRYQA